MKKVVLILCIAAIAVIACNKEDDNLNVNNPNSVSNIGSTPTISVKNIGGGHFTRWIYKAIWTNEGGKECVNGGTNCSKWVPSGSLIERLDDAIGSGTAAIAEFFLNEIKGTELESIKNDREIYAKFISGDLYASKYVGEENIIYRFYEIIDNNEVDFMFFEIE